MSKLLSQVLCFQYGRYAYSLYICPGIFGRSFSHIGSMLLLLKDDQQFPCQYQALPLNEPKNISTSTPPNCTDFPGIN